MHSSNIKYIPQIDHLRAIAAIWIIFYHGDQLIGAVIRTGKSFSGHWLYTMDPLVAIIREGHSAVALFMVLSGFIFTYGAYGKSISYGSFIFNRFLRIYPLFICVILLSATSHPEAFNLSAFITTLLPLADIQVLHTGPLTSMSWAVAVEFQFYLIFPFLLKFLNASVMKFIFAVIGTALLFRLMAIGLGANARDISYWHIFGRIDQFSAGMVAAVILRKFHLDERAMRALLVASVVMIVVVLFGFHRLGGWPIVAPWKILWPTVEGCIFSIFIISYVGAGSILPKSISRLIAFVGEESFSIYLLHFSIIYIVIKNGLFWRPTGNTGVDTFISIIAIVVPLTLLAASLTFRTIELPFLSMRRKYIKIDQPSTT